MMLLYMLLCCILWYFMLCFKYLPVDRINLELQQNTIHLRASVRASVQRPFIDVL